MIAAFYRLSLVALMLSSSAHATSRNEVSACDLAISGIFEHLNLYEYVRYPENVIRHPAKLLLLAQNIEQSMVEILLPEIEAGTAVQNFKQILKDQQAMMVAGGYRGELFLSRGDHPAQNMSRRPHPGQFVDQLIHVEEHSFAALDLTRLADVPFDPSSLSSYFAQDAKQYRLSIEGLSEESLPHNRLTSSSGSAQISSDHHFTHVYPAVKHLPEYLNLAQKHFARVLKEKESGKVVEALADYYQVLINAHPFAVGNNSLAMGQINFFLKRAKMKAVSHADLDVLALVLSSAQFRQSFSEHIRQGQLD